MYRPPALDGQGAISIVVSSGRESRGARWPLPAGQVLSMNRSTMTAQPHNPGNMFGFRTQNQCKVFQLWRPLPVSFEQLRMGHRLHKSFRRMRALPGRIETQNVVCAACSGSGTVDGRLCVPCDGKGSVRVAKPPTRCPLCQTSGSSGNSLVSRSCPICDGTGWALRI